MIAPLSAPLLLSLVLGHAVGADDPIPEPVQAWSDGLATAYAHYAAAEPAWEPQSDAFPPCPRPGEPIPTAPRSSMSEVHRARWEADPATAHAQCSALRPGGWRLQLRMTPHDQRVFSPVVLRVSRVTGDAPAEAVLVDLVERGLWAAKGYQALIPVGAYLVEVNAPCGATGLFPYDLADAVLAAEAAAPGPTAPPRQVAVSACGRRAYALQARDVVVADGQKPRELWGFRLPERRDRARTPSGTEAP